MRIGIDVDGVLYDFEENLKAWAETKYGIDPDTMPLPSVGWKFYLDQWGWSQEQFNQFYGEAINDGMFRVGDPYPECVETMNYLHDMGHELNIVTARYALEVEDEFVAECTVDWLDTHDIPWDTISVVRDKSKIANDMFLDDAVRHYTQMMKANVPTYLFDRPWNQGLDTKRRIFNWTEFKMRVVDVALGGCSPTDDEIDLAEEYLASQKRKD